MVTAARRRRERRGAGARAPRRFEWSSLLGGPARPNGECRRHPATHSAEAPPPYAVSSRSRPRGAVRGVGSVTPCAVSICLSFCATLTPVLSTKSGPLALAPTVPPAARVPWGAERFRRGSDERGERRAGAGKAGTVDHALPLARARLSFWGAASRQWCVRRTWRRRHPPSPPVVCHGRPAGRGRRRRARAHTAPRQGTPLASSPLFVLGRLRARRGAPTGAPLAHRQDGIASVVYIAPGRRQVRPRAPGTRLRHPTFAQRAKGVVRAAARGAASAPPFSHWPHANHALSNTRVPSRPEPRLGGTTAAGWLADAFFFTHLKSTCLAVAGAGAPPCVMRRLVGRAGRAQLCQLAGAGYVERLCRTW